MRFGALSPAQRRVLELMSIGCTDFEIALATNAPEPTVKSQVQAVLRKLRARNRTHAVTKAYRIRMLSRSRPVEIPEFILIAIKEKGATP